MSARRILIAALIAFSSINIGGQAVPRAGVDWPSFRGIGGLGVGDGAETPATFTAAAAIWKTPQTPAEVGDIPLCLYGTSVAMLLRCVNSRRRVASRTRSGTSWVRLIALSATLQTSCGGRT